MSAQKIRKLERLKITPVESAESMFTDEFAKYLLFLHDRFSSKVQVMRQKRAEVLQKAHHGGIQPAHLPLSQVNTDSWQVPPVPEELKKPGIEISGPVSITRMCINALNPMPDGTRAEGYLDDDEDSAGHQLTDTIQAAINRKMSIEGTLSDYDSERNREYKIQPGQLPFFMHRERGLLLDEHDVIVDGVPISASILGAALTLFYVGEAQSERKMGIYFYLPKLESAEEAGFWRDFFEASQGYLGFLKEATVRAIILVESLPAAYQMEEMLYALGPYAAGLNAARWDFKASILEYVMNDPKSVWPDRFGVDIKTTDFLANIFRRLVAVCLKRGAVPIGGMATALPSRDQEVNKAAASAIRADKVWESQQGFLRGWVAHIFHMKTAADPFKELLASGWKPTAKMANPDNYPIQIKVPEGPVTADGTRRNVRVLLEYLEGWLRGRGAKGIDSLADRPGLHPALMEDLATARISVAQIAQRILHHAKDTNSRQRHDFPLVKRLLTEELESILKLLSEMPEVEALDGQTEERYHKALKISLRWVKNYTELNFRGLGSYSRKDLDQIASEPDAF